MRRVLAVFAAAAAAGGCGGDSLSREDYAARANAICEEQQRKIDALRRPRALELFDAYLTDALPPMREQHEQLTDLEPPDADREQASVVSERWAEIIDSLEEMQKGAKAGSDIAIVIGLRRAAAAEKPADEAVDALGLSACRGFNPFTSK